MTSLSIAFMITALITGFSLLLISVDTSMYNYVPGGRVKWLVGLLIATIIFSFLSIISNNKKCTDFTVSDYKYGHVPLKCPTPPNIEEQ